MRFYRKRGKQKGPYKSGLERLFVQLANEGNLPVIYEADTFSYIISSHYTPDFKVSDTRYIETKGYLSPSNRARLICFKEQYPKIEICLLFGNWDNKLNARSKTTYREWAEKNGFRCADIKDGIPLNWFDDKDKKKCKSSVLKKSTKRQGN